MPETTAPATAANRSGILGGFGGLILKQILGEILQIGEGALEKTVTKNLAKNHPLPAAPSDADKQAFVRHATRQYCHALPVVGHALADVFRDYFTPRLAPVVVPQLTTGITTAQGAHLVGVALTADLQSLAGGL